MKYVFESTMSRKQVQLWYNQFKEGRADGNDNARTPTSDKNTEAAKKIVLDNRRITFKKVADDFGITFGSCPAIFMDVLGMKRVSSKIERKLLNFEQKQRSMDIA